MEFKTTFKFYAVEGAPYIGAYRTGSFKNGEPQIMFAMDFHTWTLKDEKEELIEYFKDGMLQTITHEFCHAMQEMLDKEFDELEVERCLGAYKPTWNVFDAPEGEPETEAVFAVSDFVKFMDNTKAETVQELKDQINEIFYGHRLWVEAAEKNKIMKDVPENT